MKEILIALSKPEQDISLGLIEDSEHFYHVIENLVGTNDVDVITINNTYNFFVAKDSEQKKLKPNLCIGSNVLCGNVVIARIEYDEINQYYKEVDLKFNGKEGSILENIFKVHDTIKSNLQDINVGTLSFALTNKFRYMVENDKESFRQLLTKFDYTDDYENSFIQRVFVTEVIKKLFDGNQDEIHDNIFKLVLDLDDIYRYEIDCELFSSLFRIVCDIVYDIGMEYDVSID